MNRLPKEVLIKLSTTITEKNKVKYNRYFATFNPARGTLPPEVNCVMIQEMVVPDLTHTIQNLLASEGFTQYRSLSFVLKALMNELEVSCPKKKYFDFGLRNLKRTIEIAKEVLQSGEQEDFSLAYALK